MKCNKSKIYERVRNRKFQTKSQMEIMGLAFVVILISLGLLFYVKFQATKTPSQLKQTFTASQKAANLLNAILKTNTECAGATITQLLQDCAENKGTNEIFCPATGQYSCISVEFMISTILTQTVLKWGDDYFLKACLWNTNSQQCLPDGTILELGTKCSELSREGAGQQESASQFIPTNSGVLKIWLDICI